MPLEPLSISEYEDPSFGANCVGCSPRNAKGLQLKFRPVGEEVWSEFVLSRDYESYDGVIHGGIVALVFDEVMGRAALWSAGGVVVTAAFRVRYAAIVVPGRRYVCKASVEVNRGQYTTSAVIEDEQGQTLCSATATFLLLSDSVLQGKQGELPAGIRQQVQAMARVQRSERAPAPLATHTHQAAPCHHTSDVDNSV